jgi:hypothetical protein
LKRLNSRSKEFLQHPGDEVLAVGPRLTKSQ